VAGSLGDRSQHLVGHLRYASKKEGVMFMQAAYFSVGFDNDLFVFRSTGKGSSNPRMTQRGAARFSRKKETRHETAEASCQK
jgi:hypothetical protein